MRHAPTRTRAGQPRGTARPPLARLAPTAIEAHQLCPALAGQTVISKSHTPHAADGAATKTHSRAAARRAGAGLGSRRDDQKARRVPEDVGRLQGANWLRCCGVAGQLRLHLPARCIRAACVPDDHDGRPPLRGHDAGRENTRQPEHHLPKYAVRRHEVPPAPPCPDAPCSATTLAPPCVLRRAV